MARTANRHLKMQPGQKYEQRIYHVGNYLRLSVDSDYTGSDSLENQRRLAKEYVDKVQDLVIAKEYVDDGKTGTHFERPAFTRMIADLKQKEIDCVIVKDLSRFGRECIEAGNYIEKVFPFLGVRFISIMDRYDSADPKCDKELLLISLKNLMHEMYAKDISRKVGSTFQMKQEKGIFYRSATIPYGYKMNQDNSNYCIDEPAAEIVRQIFSLYQQGMSKHAICQYLYENHILTPTEYRRTGRICQKTEENLKIWKITTISRILKNWVYIGNIQRHMTEQSLCKGKELTVVPKEERVLLTGNHTPIINETVFMHVQRKLERVKEEYAGFRGDSVPRKEAAVFESSMFQGKIFCASCKASMVSAVGYRVLDGREERYKLFRCRTHNEISSCCDSRNIKEKVLCDILYAVIRKHLLLINDFKKLVDRDVKYSFEGRLHEIECEKWKAEGRHAMLKREYMREYAQYKAGELTSDRFQEFRSSYGEREKCCREQLGQLEMEEKKLKKAQSSMKRMFQEWGEVDGIHKLTEDMESKHYNMVQCLGSMAQCCIERVEVFRDKRMEIRFSYQDCFAMLEQWAGEMK